MKLTPDRMLLAQQKAKERMAKAQQRIITQMSTPGPTLTPRIARNATMNPLAMDLLIRKHGFAGALAALDETLKEE